MERPPIQLGSVAWDWSRPYLLGVINVTPDSFSDGAVAWSVAAAVDRAIALVGEGADALDVGGESTRPGAHPVSCDDEIARVIPVLTALSRRVAVPLSVDTSKAEVARQAMASGATILNDVGMGDPPAVLGAVAAHAGAAYIAMHARGTPQTMATLTDYTDLGTDVACSLRAAALAVETAGVPRARVMVDPGIGFAKTAEQSLRLLADLSAIQALGYPLCVGPSRKRFIGAGEPYAGAWQDVDGGPQDRLGGTAAAVTMAVLQGVEVLRVHDVAVMRQAARVAHALRIRRPPHA